jgi:hypothetical protein
MLINPTASTTAAAKNRHSSTTWDITETIRACISKPPSANDPQETTPRRAKAAPIHDEPALRLTKDRTGPELPIVPWPGCALEKLGPTTEKLGYPP